MKLSQLENDFEPEFSFVENQNDDENSAVNFYPYGLTMNSYSNVSNDIDKYKYQGKERDVETGYDYFEARLYDAALGLFRQADPMAEERIFNSPFSGMGNNPITAIDPTGMLDVYIHGDDAGAAVSELNKSSNLKIKRDEETGKLSATGEAKSDADKLLLAAINSDKVDVHLTTKSENTYDSKDGTKNISLAPGGFEGSVVKDGKAISTQYVNVDNAKNIAKAIGEKTGETITHEINEAFIGGRDFPGKGYAGAFSKSHAKAAKADRVKENLEFNRDTKTSKKHDIFQARQKGSKSWKNIFTLPKVKQ